MNTTAPGETPHVGIFWGVQTPDDEARLLTAGCPLDQAEPYGDCLTYGPGHYETWTQWRRDRTVNPALRAIVRPYDYEDWPRGRIVFDFEAHVRQNLPTNHLTAGDAFID